MTDLEMTRLCAEAMGLSISRAKYQSQSQIWYTPAHDEKSLPDLKLYDPLHDDAQATALVKRFHLELTCGLNCVWIASNRGTIDYVSGNNSDLNRAIVECVAKMQAEKTK